MLKVYRLGKHHSTNPDTEATKEWLGHWEPLRGHTTVRELLTILQPHEDYLPLYKRVKLHKFANMIMEAWTRKGKITAKVDEYGNPTVSIIPEKEFIALQMLMAEHKTIIRTLLSIGNCRQTKMENIEFAKAIKDVKSEKVFILTNENADIINALHLLPGNRSIKQERVNQIVQAFKNEEFIPPIIVSVPSREITEGNHRYMAALKCLREGIPFTLRMYLYKDENALDTARVINNTQKRWTANDRLISYVYEGRESYVKLKSFMDAHPEIFKRTNDYKIGAALCLLAKDRTRSSMDNTFYSGNLVIKDHHVKFAEEILQELMHISDILGSTLPIDRDHSTGWIKARGRLGMPVSSFMQLLKKRAKSWQAPNDTAKAWFDMYLSIAGGF